MTTELLQLLAELVKEEEYLLRAALAHNATIQAVLRKLPGCPESGMTAEETAAFAAKLKAHADKLGDIAGGTPPPA